MLGGNGAALSPERGRWITACNICALKIPSEGQPFIDPCALMGRRRSLWPPTATRWGDAAALRPRSRGSPPRSTEGAALSPGRGGARCFHPRDSFGEDTDPTVAFPGSAGGNTGVLLLAVSPEGNPHGQDGFGSRLLHPRVCAWPVEKSWDVLSWEGP